MEILTVVLALFALASLAALVKFEGNPLFLFSFLLSAAGTLWLVWTAREERHRPRAKTVKRVKKRR